jgi:hypothetical protein
MFALILAAAVTVASFSSPAQAKIFKGPIASGTGGAGRAAVDPGESVFLNPAALAHIRRYYASGAAAFRNHEKDGASRDYVVLLADGSPLNLVKGSASYLRRYTDATGAPSEFKTQDAQLTIAGFALESVGVGLAAHRTWNELGLLGSFIQTNFNFGTLFAPYPWFGLGFVAYDFLNSDDSVPEEFRNLPKVALGTHAIFREIFRVRFDLVRQLKLNERGRNDVQMGFETFFRPEFVFRLGGEWQESRDQMHVTTGLGFHGPRLSLDYAYRKDVRVAEGGAHFVDLWMPF